jgi:N-methylhydantoinase A
MSVTHRLGIDIGGTFTDATLVDEATGATTRAKVLSTPADPSDGFMDATREILDRAAIDPQQISSIVHGTTVVTNAIIEGDTARTAFITTEGFRDLLEIARQIRPTLYDLRFTKPAPLVPRHLCFEVPERLDARGAVLRPLDEDAVRALGARLREAEVESIGVTLLHSYLQPCHERRVGELLREMLPDVPVSLSTEVAPEPREYVRASTTLVNAAIRPVAARYLSRLAARLRELGLTAELLVMQSSGGVYTAQAAQERPVYMVESGPAAGLIAAARTGETVGVGDLVSFDMGGTTAKAGLVLDGRPRITKDYEVGESAGPSTGGTRASGYPIRTPVVDLVEIGAGGGSIAWVDAGGGLRVGPRSAGADPGPACYGRGGTAATVTDANVVLGRLDPEAFLGGGMQLDAEAAWRAIADGVAEPLGLDVVTAAGGIVDIANAAMVRALRLVSVQRGHDLRDLALVAFGGAGPVHACALVRDTGARAVIVPPAPGVASSVGLLATDLEHDLSITHQARTADVDPAVIAEGFAALEGRGRAELETDGVAPDRMAFRRAFELRYVGQSHELEVRPRSDDDDLAAVVDRFHGEHERAYGFAAPGEPVELVALKVTAIGRIPKPALAAPDGGAEAATAVVAMRRVHFAEAGGFVDAPRYARARLATGERVSGPAVIEEVDSSTVVHPGFAALVDDVGNLVVSAT